MKETSTKEPQLLMTFTIMKLDSKMIRKIHQTNQEVLQLLLKIKTMLFPTYERYCAKKRSKIEKRNINMTYAKRIS